MSTHVLHPHTNATRYQAGDSNTFSTYFSRSQLLLETPDYLAGSTVLHHFNSSMTSRLFHTTPDHIGPFPIGNLPSSEEHPLFYTSVFAIIGISSVFVSLLGSAVLYYGSYRASKLLFTRLLLSVVGATMRWHDTTPTGSCDSYHCEVPNSIPGRVINRFSRDFEVLDSSIGGSLRVVLGGVAGIFGSVITITIIYPGFIIPGVIIGYCVRKLMSKPYITPNF